MYYSVSVFIMVWQCISPEANVRSFKKSCIPSAMDGTEICCGMAVKRMGMLGVCKEDEGTNCEHGDSDTDC